MTQTANFKTFLDELKALSSTNDKRAHIKRFFESVPKDGEEAKILRMYLDPDTVFGTSKKSFEKAKAIQQLHAIVDKDCCSLTPFLEAMEDLANKKVKGNAAIDICAYLWSLYGQADFVEMLILKKASGAGSTLFNDAAKEVYGEMLFDNFQVQLADKYNPDKYKKYGVEYFWATPKLDGLRATFRNGKLSTRNRKPIVGFEHIEDELARLAKQWNLDLIDGELFSKTVSFGEIQGTVTRKVNIDPEKKQQIWFNLFAVTGPDIKNTDDMQAVIESIYKTDCATQWMRYTKPLVAYKIKNDPALIKAACEKHMSEGYEGVMLRHPTVNYFYDRSEHLLKYKLFKEADFRVTQLFEGNGRLEGSLGKVLIEGEVDGKLVVSECGSGFCDADREYFWKYPDELIGATIEVKFQEVCKSEANEFYSLRFPIFLKVKADR